MPRLTRNVVLVSPLERATGNAADPGRQEQGTIKEQLKSTRQQIACTKFVKEFRRGWTAKIDCGDSDR
jgi:hypothetical protein